MRLNDFYIKLQKMDFPFFKTSDVAIICNITNSHASQLLLRLSESGQIISLKRGLWGLLEKIDRLALPYILTMPEPSYISLQSALYYHGLIMQIPEKIYAVSIARTKVYDTEIATVSIHHISTSMYFGYEEVVPYVFMATPEKALVDFLYFKQSKNRLFYALPELEIPDKFNIKIARDYISKIAYKNRRNLVLKLFDNIINSD